MKKDYKVFGEMLYPYPFRCNGANCKIKDRCKWTSIKPYEAYEFIKAPLNCNKFQPK